MDLWNLKCLFGKRDDSGNRTRQGRAEYGRNCSKNLLDTDGMRTTCPLIFKDEARTRTGILGRPSESEVRTSAHDKLRFRLTLADTSFTTVG